MCVGNKNDILWSNSTTDQELQCIRNSISDSVLAQCIDERLSALENLRFMQQLCCINSPRSWQENVCEKNSADENFIGKITEQAGRAFWFV
ncbi:hypothetical protein KP509_19G061900 [Ceratopteris richardii]|uniref:Uncharacterized protein n=1 Tax=Ceratopteris richardii TaxID=49495 RepID=A0A8T2SLP4_CERRI|nr:hypothetical protein KP509_19G061900 [Ceratopteris richardii]